MTNDCTLEAIMELLDKMNGLVIDASRNGMKDTWKHINDAAEHMYAAKRSVRRELVK